MTRGGGRNDPDRPGYQAPYDPNDPRDVGSGKDFGADLYALYRAGRVYFPDTGILFSGWASRTRLQSARAVPQRQRRRRRRPPTCSLLGAPT